MVAIPLDQSAAKKLAADHGLDWHYSDETESTNADVLRHFERYQREVSAVSEAQIAGRGRRGRQWHSPYARNIYCTIGLCKTLPANRQGLLSIVTGIALCRVLQQTAAAAVSLKWPNDLLAEGRKLGGILIESRPQGGERFFFAIGFGLNIFMPDEDLEAIAQPVTSLDRVALRPIDRSEVLIAAIDAVVQSIRNFDPAQTQTLIAEFESFDAFHGQQVEVISAGDRVCGINRGIDSEGLLRLETDQGLQLHSAAEISLQAGAE